MMPDIKTVINGLKHEIIRADRSDLDWIDCVEVSLLRDACTLLNIKDNHDQPVKPERSGKGTTWYYCCGACAQPLDPGDPYCRKCGKAVKWGDA